MAPIRDVAVGVKLSLDDDVLSRLGVQKDREFYRVLPDSPHQRFIRIHHPCCWPYRPNLIYGIALFEEGELLGCPPTSVSLPLPDFDALFEEIKLNLQGILPVERTDIMIHMTQNSCRCT